MRARCLWLCTLLLAAAPAPTAPWEDLGFALAGTAGLPHLEVTGPLTGGSALTVELTNAKPTSHAYLVLGFSSIYAPYKGGTLVPAFDLLFVLPTSELGGIKIVAHWPQDVPPGVPVVMQFWINDEQAIAGRAGSNAMGTVTP
jgi:hypothetical protein